MLKIGSTITKEYNLDNMINPLYSQLHRDGAIHIHDLDFASLCFNCLQIPLGKLLDDGFATSHGYIRSPSTIGTAATLACIIVQADQNDMFGGQAIPTFDYDLAPYVAKSFVRNCAQYIEVKYDHLSAIFTNDNLKKMFIKPLDTHIIQTRTIMNKEGKQFIVDTFTRMVYNLGYDESCFNSDEQMDDMFEYATKHTEKETYQAMEGVVHNLCTLASRAGSQVPFSSLNTGTCTDEEGRMVTRNLFLAEESGLGNGETAIFPISIFKLKNGINRHPGEPNYDLFQLGLRVTAKRLFPNFNNLDAPFNLKYYKEGRPETEVATMGALAHGNIQLYGNTCSSGIIDISEAINWLRGMGLLVEKSPIKFDEYTEYYNVKPDVFIYDTIKHCLTQIKKVMTFNSPDTKWCRVGYHITGYRNDKTVYSIYKSFLATDDHPLAIRRDNTVSRISVCDIKENDELISNQAIKIWSYEQREVADHVTCTIAKVEPCEHVAVGYDFETESDRFDVDDFVSHNCRTRTIGNVYDPSHEQVTGRGNLFFTTINLPYLALEAKAELAANEDIIELFMEKLDKRLEQVVNFSMDRFEIIAKRKAMNYPFLMGQGLYIGSEKLRPDDEVREIIKQGSMTAGFIGLAETLQVLVGKHHGESDEAQKLGISIVKYMNDYMDRVSTKLHLNFGVMGSPAEGCAGRLLRLTREKFGVIEHVTDRDYFTNSFHVPVYYPISVWDKINIEAVYHQYCPAGHISYIELDADVVKNLPALESIVDAMADAGMGYFAINHPVDRDPVCGYVGFFPNDTCPRCGRKDGEGVSVLKLLSLTSYSPDPKYAVNFSELEEDDVVPNNL